MDDNTNVNHQNNRSRVVLLLAVLAVVILGLVVLVVRGSDTEEDGTPNENPITTSAHDSLPQPDFSRYNRGNLQPFPMSLEAGDYTCEFSIDNDTLQQGGSVWAGSIWFILTNQAPDGFTEGTHNGEPALYVKNQKSLSSYSGHYIISSKGKDDPVMITTNMEEWVKWSIECFEYKDFS